MQGKEKIAQSIEFIEQFIGEHDKLSIEIVKARETFFERTGTLRESDPSYHYRMRAFLLWFAFNWPLNDQGLTPFHIFMSSPPPSGRDVDYEFCSQLNPHSYTLFELLKIAKGETIVRHLQSGKKIRVQDVDALFAVEKGTYFETRIFHLNEGSYFADYFIFHPLSVQKEINKQIKLIKKQPELMEKLLLKLHHFHTKWENYRNIDLKFIYHFDKSIPEAK